MSGRLSTWGLGRGLAAALLALAGTGATAQTDGGTSALGCRELEQAEHGPIWEGRDGYFFREPDLRMHLPYPDRAMDLIAALSDALATQDTAFVFVPIPSKAQVLSDRLPGRAGALGYDAEVSIALYRSVLDGLEARGVVTVDVIEALRGFDPDRPPFHRTDFHWTAAGAEAAAMAVARTLRALPAFAGIEPRTYRTEHQHTVPVNAPLRRQIQMYCAKSIAPVMMERWTTTPVEAPEAAAEEEDGGLDLFGAEEPRPEVVLAGTSYSADEQGNFAGWISQFSGAETLNVSIVGGNQYGSMMSYLTSDAYREGQPRILIWETPIYSSLLNFGDAPLLELIAAARPECEVPLEAVADGSTLGVDLSQTPLTPHDVLRAEAGRAGYARASFTLTYDDGLTRTVEPRREDRWTPTGRFHVPVAGLEPERITAVTVDFHRKTGRGAQLSLCRDNDDS